MRVQSVTLNNYGVKSLNNKTKNKVQSNPQFKGYELDYKAGFNNISHTYCTLYKDGKLLLSGDGGLYNHDYRSAVNNAVYELHPEGYGVKIIPRNINNNTGKIYIASPDEEIPEEMQKKYDFIVYDSMPPMVTLKDLDHKFHAIYGDSDNYSEKITRLINFHNRMYQNDTEEEYKWWTKYNEDKFAYNNSVKYRDMYALKIQRGDKTPRTAHDYNTAEYFVSENGQKLVISSAQNDKYSAKSTLTREKLNFLYKLEDLMNRANPILDKRDIAARKLAAINACIEGAECGMAAADFKIKSKFLLKTAKEEQLKLMEETLDNFEKQNYMSTDPHYRRDYSYATSKLESLVNKDEMLELKKEIEKYKEEIRGYKAEKYSYERTINKNAPLLAQEKEKVQALIDEAEPIYQELKAYYEANNPF